MASQVDTHVAVGTRKQTMLQSAISVIVLLYERNLLPKLAASLKALISKFLFFLQLCL